ncbi:MAG TPA: mechanosensitive ion channel family protein [Pseudolabrys sp.]|nr:mechanosensitive ion channel family protein [Pseudolabrys sp.]
MAATPPSLSQDAAEAPKHVADAFELVLGKLDSWLHDFILLLPNLIVGLIVALIFVGIAHGVGFILHHSVARAGRHDLGYVLGRFAYWFTVLLGVLVVLTIVLPSMHPVDIFTSLGIGSIAIGFAFKDVLQNWLAGLLILIRRPFKRGDQIKVGNTEGTVQAVETRATLVKTFSGRLVIIPNSEIYTQSVTVNTAYDIRRTEIVVPLGLEVDLEHAIEVIRGALAPIEDVLDDPKPDVLPWEFSNNNVNVVVRWWTKSQRTYEVRSRALVVQAVKHACESAGIALPADTKISFAAPEFVVALKRSEASREPARAPTPSRKPPQGAPSPPRVHADERKDPEAERPKEGELNEGKEEVPR